MNGSTLHELDQVLRHEAALRRLAAALCRDPGDAEDAVQHAMSQAALGRRAPGTPLLAFLKTTLRNHAANLRKLAQRRRHREQAVSGSAGTESPVDELVARDELRRRVSQAVLALAEPYRTTVWLRWFEGLSVDDVAARMHVPRNTVRTRLQRGHAQLRDRLDRDYGGRGWLLVAAPWTGSGDVGAALGTARGGRPAWRAPALLASAVVATVLGFAVFWPSGDPATPPRVEGGAQVQTARSGAGAAPPLATRLAVPLMAQVRFESADGRPLANAPVWFWRGDERPRWTRRARPGRTMAGIDNQRDVEPAHDSALRTDAAGAIDLPGSAGGDGALRAVSVRFASELWYSTELPVEGPIVLPATAVVTARIEGAPAGSEWEARFSAVIDGGWDSARCDVTTSTGAGVVWVGQTRQRAGSGRPLSATVLKGTLVKADRAIGHGFEVDRDVEAPAAAAPCEFVFAAAGPVPRIEVAVVDAHGAPVDVEGYAIDRGIGRPQWLERGVARFDSHAHDEYGKVLVRLADGRWFERTVNIGPEEDVFRIELPLAEAEAPIRIEVPAAFGEVTSVRLEARPSNPWWDLGRYASAHYGFSVWEWGCDDHGVWVAGIPEDWKQLALVLANGRVGRVRQPADGPPRIDWEPATPAVTIDAATYFADCSAPPHAVASLEIELPYVVERRYGGRSVTAQWKDILWHRRDPDARVVVDVPVWRDLHLPTELPWRLCIRDSEGGTVAEYRRLF